MQSSQSFAHSFQFFDPCGQNTQPNRKAGNNRLYDRIQGELAKVGYQISDTTVENILKSQGI
jgi:hypothetical protein